jgi:hypothetical protein
MSLLQTRVGEPNCVNVSYTGDKQCAIVLNEKLSKFVKAVLQVSEFFAGRPVDKGSTNEKNTKYLENISSKSE